jgi:F0F1-type ATP synthase membrane subunit c/vacuolar-type H+-ATPase subunit K
MLVITAVKFLVIAFTMLPISMGALGTGILFSGYSIAVSRNPEESENIFSTTLMAFALIETFVFLSIVIAIIAYFV